jgi:hypothetical protein
VGALEYECLKDPKFDASWTEAVSSKSEANSDEEKKGCIERMKGWVKSKMQKVIKP